MLGYEVKLKSKAAIEELCYETEEGGLGQDYISFDYDLLNNNGFYSSGVTLAEVVQDQDEEVYYYKIKNNIGQCIYVHLDWLGSIGGYEVIEHKKMSDTMVKVTRKSVINPKTGEITLTNQLPMCSCGAVGTVTYSDGTHICNDCVSKLTVIEGYSYRPDYKFIGTQLKADTDTPVWYGLEIEMATNKDKLAEYMSKYGRGDNRNVYLKSDSSIRGEGYKVEMVSMPHSFNALMANDSWLSNIDVLPAEERKENGCHVHISRTSFKDDRHYSLFYFLIHKMERVATKVGGRALTSYCELAPTGKVHKKGNKKESNSGRTVFLNETNDVTVEARFFQGTTKVTNLKAYVQFLESLIKYTKYHSKTVTSKGWFGYITKKSKKYNELLAVLGDIDTDTLTDSVTYREPLKEAKDFTKLLTTEINAVVEITLSNGKVYKDVEITSVNRSRVEFYYNDKNDHRHEPITSITKLVIERD